MKTERVEKVLEQMKALEIPQAIIADSAAIFYLTGKWIHPGERLVALYLNVSGNHKLFINELFPVTEDLGVEKVWYNDTQDPVAIMADYIEKNKTIAIDKNWPARFLLKLIDLGAGSKFVSAATLVDTVRMCKDEEEKEFMREASRLNDMAIERLAQLTNKGFTEKEMASKLAEIYQDLGAEGFSFDPIIAYGANAADPHHEPDDSKGKTGDSVILDIGCKKNSYCSDMTRTVFLGEPSENAREVYEIVREANMRAIAMIKPGVKFSEIDATARDYITSKGYGEYFTHRLGHSIGIEVHDLGNVSAVNNEPVKEGMIFSIEPGIYIAGKVGVRIEDLVLVTKDGCEVLNKVSKELKVIK
ncbi:Xaa-Pro peptidase family protein [Clostridium cadaveris]|uniref:M24 family metallopeptidase n=1 Tax=Clostridium cadaveris TaxID=1529 RepID=UPI001E3254CB|nr:Xaa-Pro peptidase family protein [Clostridium cadaveris]UFH65365.1 Xaa-Pro peptidase family protein [Clostridium cadaveris]